VENKKKRGEEEVRRKRKKERRRKTKVTVTEKRRKEKEKEKGSSTSPVARSRALFRSANLLDFLVGLARLDLPWARDCACPSPSSFESATEIWKVDSERW